MREGANPIEPTNAIHFKKIFLVKKQELWNLSVFSQEKRCIQGQPLLEQRVLGGRKEHQQHMLVVLEEKETQGKMIILEKSTAKSNNGY